MASPYEKYQELGLHLAEGVMTVTLNNPARRNATTPQMSLELTTIWQDLGIDPEVKVIILTGAGDDFCSGADLSARARRTEDSTAHRPVHPVSNRARKHIYSLLECEKPVLAKVRGVAYGIGASLALGCDMVFAAEGARFCDSHVKAGMVAGDGGVLLWPLLIGPHRAKQFLMTGDPVPAELAASMGLINRCVPNPELDETVLAMAHKLRDLPPHAVNYTKASINIALRQMTGSAFEASLAYELYSLGMQDCQEAAAAFAEKRPGKYQGR